MNKFEEVYLKIISEEAENLIQSNTPYQHGDWSLLIKRHATPDNNFFTWDAKNIKTGQHWIIHNQKEHDNIEDALAEIKEELDKKEYTAIFSFYPGMELKGDDFLTLKKEAYKLAEIECNSMTDIKIFDPSKNLVLYVTYAKDGFENGKKFKVVKGGEF